ncbi:hypothetical protein SOVF_214610, partial [Spinacia oleracea]
VQVLTVCQSRKDSLEESVEDVNEEVRSYGSYMMERLTGSEDGRIDHVLQVCALDIISAFLSF